jgi:hypothetical protein
MKFHTEKFFNDTKVSVGSKYEEQWLQHSLHAALDLFPDVRADPDGQLLASQLPRFMIRNVTFSILFSMPFILYLLRSV